MKTISPLYGPIIGDIVGSFYEGRTPRNFDFKLFSRYSHFTDDTIMTIAVAHGLTSNNPDKGKVLQQYALMYPDAGYGDLFWKWIRSEDLQPNDSYANGAAMRASPFGFMAQSLFEANHLAKHNASLTHSNSDAIDGAKLIAKIVFLAWRGYNKLDIKGAAELFGKYDFNTTVQEIRDNRDKLSFDCSAINTVKHAICAFLESTDFESAVRLAVYIGGDTDTIASMAGAIAVAFYKQIPEFMVKEANERLHPSLIDVIDYFDECLPSPGKVTMIL